MVALAQTPAQTTSNTSAPASITPTLGQASIAGNLLVLIVVCSSTGTPSISTPASWLNAQNFNIAGLACAIFYYPNNPGGITSVAVTLNTTTAGGACATLVEFSGMGTVPTLEYNGNQSGNGNNPLSFTFPLVIRVGELSIYAVGSGAATQTITTSREWSQLGTQQTSTNAATINAALSCFWAVNGYNTAPQITGGSLSVSVNWIDVAARFAGAGGGGITNDNISGNAGILVGQYYQGNIGG